MTKTKRITGGEGFRVLLALCAVLAVMVLPGQIMANGTTAGSNVLNSASADFNDQTGSAQPTVTSATLSASVTNIYGISTLIGPTNNIYTTAGATNIIEYRVANGGNSPDSLNVDFILTNRVGPGGALWTYEVYWDDGDRSFEPGAGDAQVAQGGSVLIAEGVTNTLWVRVITATDASNSSREAFVYELATASTPVGFYTNFYGDVYGGFGLIQNDDGYVSTNVWVVIQSPVITLTKTQAYSTASLSGYTGPADLPVPGAEITYTIAFTNSGSGAADSLTVTDSIPVFAAYLTNSISANNDAGLVDGVDYFLELFDGGTWSTTEPAYDQVQAVRIRFAPASDFPGTSRGELSFKVLIK